MHISRLSQSTSSAIKNHSGVKTGRVAETRAIQLPQVIGPKSLRLSQGSKIILEIHINYMMNRKNSENRIHRAPITEEVKEFGEIGRHNSLVSKISETSYFQSQMHFDDCVESIADCDLEDGEQQKMLTSPLYAQKASEKPDVMVVQEREVSAQFAQPDRKKSLSSHSSEGQKASGKPDALFSSEQGNLIRSSVFRNADPSNLRGSLLEGNIDHLLSQARSDLMKQELQMLNLSIVVSVTFSNKLTLKDWNCRTHNTEMLNLDENKFDYKKNYR